MGTFRLLHLSDFHFAKRDTLESLVERARNKILKVADIDVAEGVARFAKQRADQIDAILVTGDLATSGEIGDLERALEFVDSLPSRDWLNSVEKPTLKAANCPVFLFPGNHDRFKDVRGMPGCVEFDRIFGGYWKGAQGVSSFVVEVEGERLSIIAADLTLRSRLDSSPPFFCWGQGRAYEIVVDELKRETTRLRKAFPLSAVAWATHFPPEASGVDAMLRLLEGDRIIRAAEELAVSHIFCGHIHRPLVYQVKEVQIYCAGSATCYLSNRDGVVGRGNFIHRADIQINSGVIVEIEFASFSWSDASASFVEMSA